MRILLDECVNQRLRNHLPEYECQSAKYAGRGGLKNGELLAAAEAAGFLLTVDRGFQYEQNLIGRKIAELHVSQPSLSVQIKQLEDELGVALFRRSKRRVEITRAGEVFLSAAREILLRLQQPSAAALHAERGEVGTIRLAFIPTASLQIFPRLLDKIRSTLPLVNV